MQEHILSAPSIEGGFGHITALLGFQKRNFSGFPLLQSRLEVLRDRKHRPPHMNLTRLGSSNPGGWGQGGMSTSSGTLNLKGGLAVVNSASGDHDAFDSNGALTVTGGYYCANGQEPCDYDGAFTNNGGTFITMSAGNGNLNTSYTFTDASGNAVATIVSASGAGLKSGSAGSAVSGAQVSGGTEILTQAGNYKVTIGGSVSGGNALGAASEGGMQPGGPGSRP